MLKNTILIVCPSSVLSPSNNTLSVLFLSVMVLLIGGTRIWSSCLVALEAFSTNSGFQSFYHNFIQI